MTGLSAEEQRQRFCTRLTSAVSTLFADPDFRPPTECFRLFLTLHEWIGVLFSATASGNADHVARYLNPRGPADAQFLPGRQLHREVMRALFDRVRTGTRLRRTLGVRQNHRGLSRPRSAGTGVQGLAKRASQARGAAGVAARQAAADRRPRRSALGRAAQRLYVLQLCRYAAAACDQAGHQCAGAPQARATRPDRPARAEAHACQRQTAARQKTLDGGRAGVVQRRPFDLPHAFAYARSRARTFRSGGLRLRLRRRRGGAEQSSTASSNWSSRTTSASA